jgi:hypothetical protein
MFSVKAYQIADVGILFLIWKNLIPTSTRKTPCFKSAMGISPSLLLLSLPGDTVFTDRRKVSA